MAEVYDKKGIPIHVDDVLKVFHFTGPRRKKYYMYKHVVGETETGSQRVLLISHLQKGEGTYNLLADGQCHRSIEIVQGYGGVAGGRSYEDRPRKKVTDGKL